ncbi:hypothetical protein J6590_097337 [Homalodisca vitripennis]|nr:hypothetical protein J6590_097337 [Homalodisca vitripennis]
MTGFQEYSLRQLQIPEAAPRGRLPRAILSRGDNELTHCRTAQSSTTHSLM